MRDDASEAAMMTILTAAMREHAFEMAIAIARPCSRA